MPVREEQGSRILLKLLEVESNNVQGAAQNVELYMAFAQRAHTIPLLLLLS